MLKKLSLMLSSSAIFLLLGANTTFAEEVNRESNMVNVTVPSSLNLVFNEDGTNSIDSFSVRNDSLVPITVNNISTSLSNSWNLVPSSTDIPKDTKQLAFSVEGKDLVSGSNAYSILIGSDMSKNLSVHVKRGVWSKVVNEKALDLTVDYSIGKADFTVSFNENGGNSVSSITGKNGDIITLPSTSKIGYNFNGWEDSTGKVYPSDSKYTIPIGGSSLKAKWTAWEFILKYDGNGSTSGVMEGTKVKFGDRYTLLKNQYIKTGYNFNGWYAKLEDTDIYRYQSNVNSSSGWYAEGTQPSGWEKMLYPDSSSFYVSSSKKSAIFTLEAQWTADTNTKYTINHYQMNLDGSTYSLKDTETKTGTSDSSLTLSNLKRSYTGFTYLNGKVGNSIVTSTTISADGSRVIDMYYDRNSYYLDLGGVLDGVESVNTNDYGTFDVYIDNKLVSQGVSDYYKQHLYGTSYEIKNITATTGHNYIGVSGGSIKGTVSAERTGVNLAFNTNKFTVKYNGDGSTSGAMGMVTSATYGTNTKLEKNLFVKTGYTFTGWSAQRNSDSKIRYVNPNNTSDNGWYLSGQQPSGWTYYLYQDQDNILNTSSVNEDVVTMNAQWRVNKLYIQYNMNGGSLLDTHGSYIGNSGEFITNNGSINVNSYSYGGSLPNGGLPDWNNPKSINIGKVGYTALDGGEWNTKSDGTGKSYSDDIVYALSDFADLSDGDKTITLYVNWKPNTYSISYQPNGGNGTTITSSHIYDTAKALTSNGFSRLGYSFTGWNTKADGSGTVYSNSQSVKNLTSVNGETVTLYAQWALVNYTISYNLNGGSVSENPTSYNIETAAFTLKNPTKTGYTFKGWTGSNGGSVQTTVTIPSGSTGNKSYVANWEANTYTYDIVYKSSSGKSLGTSTVSGEHGSSKVVTAPSKDGYTTPSSQTVVFDSDSSKTITFTYPLIEYTIGYNLNGGQMPIINNYYRFSYYDYTDYADFGTSYSNVDLTDAISITTDNMGNMAYSFQLIINGKYKESNSSISEIPNEYKKSGNMISFMWSVRDGTRYQPGLTVTRAPKNRSSYNIETPSFTLSNPTLSGKTFSGWTGSNGTTVNTSVTIPTGSTGNKAYSANWR